MLSKEKMLAVQAVMVKLSAEYRDPAVTKEKKEIYKGFYRGLSRLSDTPTNVDYVDGDERFILAEAIACLPAT